MLSKPSYNVILEIPERVFPSSVVGLNSSLFAIQRSCIIISENI